MSRPHRTDIPALLTVPQVAEILNVSFRTVRRLIKSGKLRKVLIGSSVRVSPEVLQEYIKKSSE